GYTERTVLVTVLLQASYRGSKERQLLRTFEKPPGKVVFSFSRHEITRRKKGSQEDPFRLVFRVGFFGCHPPPFI
ncbi:hypothetical protein K1573_27265, partial [Salmonella enterica]